MNRSLMFPLISSASILILPIIAEAMGDVGAISNLPPPLPLEPNHDIPYFEESRGALVLRFNPQSDSVSDPVLRDVIASVLLAGIADAINFPRGVGKNSALELSPPAFTGPIMEYDKALEDFGGPAPSIEALAESSGLVSEGDIPVLSSLTPAVMSEMESVRPVLRKSLQKLTGAGYTMDKGQGLLVASDGELVELTVAIPGPFFSPDQREGLESAARYLRPLGITVRIIESSVPYLSDLSVDVERNSLYSTLIKWTTLFGHNGNAKVKAFISGLPERLTPHEEITALAVLDAYIASTGYVVALAETQPHVDYSDPVMRAAAWRTREAFSYIKNICGSDTGIFFSGRTETHLAFRNEDHPLVIYLPREGGMGSDLQLALLATEEQVGISNRGVLHVQLPDSRDESFPAQLVDKPAIDIPVNRVSRTLLFENAVDYLDVARWMNHANSNDGVTRAPMIFEEITDAGMRTKQPVLDDLISAESLNNHEFTGVPECAANIYLTEKELTFSILATSE